MANLGLDPTRHGNGTEKPLQLCSDVTLKNIVGLRLDSHPSAPDRDSEKEMSLVLSPESWRRAKCPHYWAQTSVCHFGNHWCHSCSALGRTWFRVAFSMHSSLSELSAITGIPAHRHVCWNIWRKGVQSWTEIDLLNGALS